MAGQIAHNFDEEDGWMIPGPLWREMKLRISSVKKRNHKKKKKYPMQNLHPAIKWGRAWDAKAPLCEQSAFVRKQPHPAGPGCLPAEEACHGQTIPDICNYSKSICF